MVVPQDGISGKHTAVGISVAVFAVEEFISRMHYKLIQSIEVFCLG